MNLYNKDKEYLLEMKYWYQHIPVMLETNFGEGRDLHSALDELKEDLMDLW